MTIPISTSMSPKVLLLTDSDVFAGTERHILDLALGLRESGAILTVSAPRDAMLARRGADFQLPNLAIEKGGLLDLRAVQILRRALKRGDFEVIHAHNGRTQLSATLATTLAGRGANVFTQHFIGPNHSHQTGAKSAVWSAVHGFVNARTHRFIAISHAVCDEMLRRRDADSHRIDIVPNGIGDPLENALESREAVRNRFQIDANAPLLVCVARLAQEKDHASLLTAFANLRDEFPTARLLLAGDGAQKVALQGQIEALQLGDTARILGFVADCLSLIHAADTVVLPSPREPFGLVFLEAMALSKPVVAINGGAAPEIVINGETGILAAPCAPDSLQHALETVLRDAALSKRLGEAGRARFSTYFTRAAMAKRTLQSYANALSSNGGRR